MLPQTKSRIANPKSRAMLLAALYIAQEQYGWLSPEAIQRVADRLNLTPGQVHSTASFYTMFKLQPHGKYRIQICEGLSCYLVGGAEPIIEYITKRLNIIDGDASPNGKFTLEIVQCLAACDLAPAIKVNDELYGNISLERLDEFISKLSALD
ncbi:MAG TPA: NAD(P)H-dependent oxidoreductase subunit E [Anaerolineales bacterium]|nr:NAD(P)H-dependent oxidoreductase subunit E [Anaerolineales bacterium]